MTKIQKSKKTIASLLAGILLCQVSAFGVSQTSVNAENPARKLSFEVVGEGSVTVTDVEDCIRTVQSGSEITVPDRYLSYNFLTVFVFFFNRLNFPKYYLFGFLTFSDVTT